MEASARHTARGITCLGRWGDKVLYSALPHVKALTRAPKTFPLLANAQS